MTGSLFAPLPLSSPSPANLVASNYSVDAFSEHSTRTVNRAFCSPTSAASGPRSGRAKEDDEELFRDLFAAENDAETNDESLSIYKVAAPSFIPQKPATERISSSPGNPNPRHLAPMKPVLQQPLLPTPFIPRLKLEELVNARPDDDFEVDDNNNNSRRTSRLGSELEQVTEEDDNCFDDILNEDKVGTRKTHDRGLNSSSQISDTSDKLDQELQFLEKLDLKAVLHTPRPDLLSFYPAVTKTPTARMGSPQSKISSFPAKPTEGYFVENHPEDKIDVAKNAVVKEPVKVSRVDVGIRLAYMKSTYGTAPIVRKTRRETIDRLANPISGHSSTLQALSPKQREKREAALTTRAPLSPMSAAIAVTCRRSTATKKTRSPLTLLGGLSKRVGDCEIPVPTVATSKRKINKRQDPLVQKRRSNSTNPHADGQVPTIRGLTKRKSKTTLGFHSLDARKEALKKKLQSRSVPTKRGKIGGSTFLTQRDDEEGIELIEDFIARNRGAARTSLTFRTSEKSRSRNVIPALPTKSATTARSRPQPTQTGTGATFTRSSSANRSTFRERGLDTLTERKNERPRAYANSNHGKPDHDPVRLFQQPRRPQVWQTSLDVGYSATSTRSLTGRPTTATNPLLKLKVHPVMPALLPRAPKAPSSAATTVLMGSGPLFSMSGATASEVKSARAPRRGTKKTSRRKIDTATTFEAPKVSEQRKRISTTGEKAPISRKTFADRRSTSRV